MLIVDRHLRKVIRLTALANWYLKEHLQTHDNLDSEEARLLITQAIGILQGVRDGMAAPLPVAPSVTVVETPCGRA